MEFKPFEWPAFDPTQGLYTRLDFEATPKYSPAIVNSLRAEALSCGLNPDSGYIWAVIRQIRNEIQKPFHMALIGDAEVIRFGHWIHTFIFPNGEEVILQPWLTVFKSIDHPMELHQKFHNNSSQPVPSLLSDVGIDSALPFRSGPGNAILKADFKKKADMATLWSLHKLLNREVRRGRPRGAKPSPEQFEHMKRDTIAYLAQEHSQEKICEFLGIGDTKTLRKYMKMWGINCLN